MEAPSGSPIRLISERGDGTTLQVSAEALTIGQTYLIEVYFSLADSGGRSVVKVDHIPWIDYTGDTKPGADTTIDNVFWGGRPLLRRI